MWRTYAAGKWHSLAVYEGLPPQSITGRPRPLNAGNFSVDIPLIDGENYFTIVGEPGPITATDSFQRFAVNLYFDGGLNTPGVSVLFERYAPDEGGPTSPNRAQYLYSFDAIPAAQRTSGVDDRGYDAYDDGFERVTVTGASFLPEDRFLSIDLVGGQRFGQSGTSDFVGSLVVLVEPSEGGPAIGGIGGGGIGSGGGVGGGRTRTGLPGNSGGVAGAPYIPGYANPGGDRPRQADPEGVAPSAGGREDRDQFQWVSGGDDEEDSEVNDVEGTPTPRDVASAFRDWITSGLDETPTPADAATPDGTASISLAVTGTPTPGRSPSTATPGKTSSVATTTVTPPTLTPTITPSPNPTPSIPTIAASDRPRTRAADHSEAPAAEKR